MALYIEKLRVIQKFIQAQGSVCLTLTIIFLLNRQFENMIAVLLAVLLQWLQLYTWAKPTRVSMTKNWLQGIYRGVALKFLLFTFAILMLFMLKPEGYYLNHSKQLLGMAVVFLVSYTIPYWYFCFISERAKKTVSS